MCTQPYFTTSCETIRYRSTVGRRSFPVAASVLWNSLPLDIQSSPSLTVFRHRLKTFLFHKSFPTFYSFAVHALVVSVIVHYLSHGKNHDWLTDWSIPLRYDTIRKINVRSKADEMASSSLNKTCQLDPAPTWLIKEQRSLLSPFIALLFNKSLATAVSQRSTDMPSSFRY